MEDKAVLAVWDPDGRMEANGGWIPSPSASSIMEAAERAIRQLPHRTDFRGWQSRIRDRSEFRLSTAALRTLALSLGMSPGNKRITDSAEKSSSDFYRGLLRGLFDTDGSVQGTQEKGVSVRLTQVDLDNLARAQRMLLRLGIYSTLYRDRKPAGTNLMPDGNGGLKQYRTQAVHELVISGANLLRFQQAVGFAHADKAQRLEQLLAGYRRALNRERFMATVERVEADGVEDVFDVQVPGVHAFDANGFYVHNCGEQALPSYGCCCLGSVNLTPLVANPFTEKAAFDFEAFGKVVRVAIRMLDNVLDATVWPLPQQAEEARNKRRVGLGFTGLGDALIMLGLRYDTEPAREMAAKIAEHMRDEAYAASVEIAQEKGAFPLFDAQQYLAEPRFASRLPQALKEKIRKHGLRNSHLLSIAPTGTISLAFADNASNGIEPPFSWTYQRKKREPDNTFKVYDVEDHAWRLYKHLGGNVEKLPPEFVTALEISALDHMRMVAAVVAFRGLRHQQDGERPRGLSVRELQGPLPGGVEVGAQGHHHLPAQQGAGQRAFRHARRRKRPTTSTPPTPTAASASRWRPSRRCPACAGRVARRCPPAIRRGPTWWSRPTAGSPSSSATSKMRRCIRSRSG